MRTFQQVPFRFTLLALCCSISFASVAATEITPGTVELGATDINAQKTDEHALPPAFSGGQVARGGQLGVLGNADIMDVPFTMSSYTEQLIEDQQAEDIGDVLANDSSVRQSFGFGNSSQVFMIRGLPLSGDDISYNGLYGVLPRQVISTDALERVELFKGPNAFVNGVTPTGSGIGGGVNLQPKRAQDTPTRRFTTDISTDGRVGEHLDVGQRFGEDNRFGARVNLAQREGETGIEDEKHRSKLFSIGLDYRGDDLRVSGDFAYQKQRINQGRNTVRVGAGVTRVPNAPDADTNYAPKWYSTETEDTFGMLRSEYDLNDNWTVYAAGGAKHTREVGNYGTPVLSDNLGNARIASSFIPHDEDNVSAMAGINGKLQTGPVSHKLNFGLAGIWTEQRNAYDFGGSYLTNIYDPVSAPRPAGGTPGGDLNDPGITGKTRNRSVAISDTLGFFDDRLLLTAGLRRQQLRVQGFAYGTGTRTSVYDEAITTPVYGIVFKPWQHVSVYANRIEGLAQGDTAPVNSNIVNPGEVFAPSRSKQLEAGVKVDMGTYGASLGVYRIEQVGDGYESDIGGGRTRYVVDGKQVNKGVETNIYGEPISGLRLIAGLTLMDTELKDTRNGVNDGNNAVGVPTFQFNAGADWDIPGIEGAALNARMLRTGGQYIDPANNLSIPTWNRFDAGARYTFNVAQKDITLRANVQNLTNEKYWESAYGGYLAQGEPRTVKFSGTVDF